MNNPKKNNTTEESPRIANRFAAMSPTRGFIKVLMSKPICKLAAIGTIAKIDTAVSIASINGINVNARITAPTLKNGTMIHIEKIFGTLIPKLANAFKNTRIAPITTTIHTYAIIGNVTMNVFKKYNPTRPTINHLAIVNGIKLKNPAGAPMIVKIPIKSRSLNPSIASKTPISVSGIAKIVKIAKAWNKRFNGFNQLINIPMNEPTVNGIVCQLKMM